MRVRSIAQRSVPAAAAVLKALDQLEVARGALVEGQVVLEGEGLDAREVRQRRLLRLLEVGEHRPRSAARPAPARQAEPLDRRDAEMGAQAILGLAESEARRIARGHRHSRRLQARRERVVCRNARREQHLRGPAEEKRLRQALDVGGLPDPEVGGRHVHQGDAQMVRAPPHRREEVVEAAVEESRLGDGPRRDEPDHLAPDQLPALGRRRLHLVADGDLQPRPDEPREVHVESVVRHPGHRDRAVPLLTRGERDVERAGRHGGVLVERLVEVTEPEEQQVVRIAPLPLLVLAHHRREGRAGGGLASRSGRRGRSPAGLGVAPGWGRGASSPIRARGDR